MKKIKYLSLLLCLIMTMQCFVLPVSAAEATETAETTLPPDDTPGGHIVEEENQAVYGTVSIQNGCRTLNGMSPLGGKDRMLDSAQAVFLYEVYSDTVVYAYNPDTQIAPGNLAKMVTSLLALEMCELNDVVTVSSRNISRLPAHTQNQKLKEEEQLSVKDLVYCTMLVEANDAAIALAEHIAGTQQAFVDLMNQRVKQMGCTNTNFGNVHGLATAASVTTARDMAKITVEAMKNEKFADIFNDFYYEVPATNRSEMRPLITHNYMMDQRTVPDFYDKNIIGGMPAYSDAIGANLISVREEKGMKFVGVVLGCHRLFDPVATWKPINYGNFNEMTELFNYAYDKYKVNRILYEGMSVKQFPVSGGESNAVGHVTVNYDSIVPISASMDNLVFKYYVEDLSAPIDRDEKIGTLEIWYRDSCMAEAEMFSMGPVKNAARTGVTIRSTAVRSDSDAAGFLSVLGTICVVILGLAMAYLAFNAYMRSRIRAQRRRRREARRRAR